MEIAFKLAPMSSKTTARYAKQRVKKIPPYVPIGLVRMACGLTIDQLLDKMEASTGLRPERGTISAIENGHRGASLELLAALEMAYGLPDGSISTTYVPRDRHMDVAS